MPRYRIHRLKESQKEHFRWSAHTGGLAVVKPVHYEPGGEVEGQTPYSLWKDLKASWQASGERPLSPGDLLERIDTGEPGPLLIVKYIGFEAAKWFVPEIKTASPGTGFEDEPQPSPHLGGIA